MAFKFFVIFLAMIFGGGFGTYITYKAIDLLISGPDALGAIFFIPIGAILGAGLFIFVAMKLMSL